MLNMFDQVGVKVTSHILGVAVEIIPQLAREIVQHGHETAEHGRPSTR